MSYARWGNDSDVYVYEAAICDPELGGGFVCCGCAVRVSRAGMVSHPLDHLEHFGHSVPEEAIEQLMNEIYASLDARGNQ